jgi:MFS family permease
MADNPGVAERFTTMGFTEAVVREIVAEVPTVRSARSAFLGQALIALPLLLVAQGLGWSLMQILANVVIADHLSPCGSSARTYVNLAGILQFVATGAWFGLAVIVVSSCASRNWRARLWAYALLNLYTSGQAPGLAQRILAKAPDCETWEDFYRVSRAWEQKLALRMALVLQVLVVLVLMIAPAICR